MELRFKFWNIDSPLPNFPVPYSIYIVQDGAFFKMYPVDKNGNYLEATILNVGVESVSGDGVDNTNPNNPILSFPNADEINDSTTVNKFVDQLLINLINSAIQPNDNISNLINDVGYLTSFTEQNDLTQNVVWTNVPDLNITQSSVTQHQSSLSILESQVVGLNYFVPSTLLNDYGFNDNSSNWNTAFSWGDWSVGVDKTFVDSLSIDSDTLDGQQGSFYLDYNNFVNTPTDNNDIDYISNVVLNGNNLEFTNVGNAFGSSIDLSASFINKQGASNQFIKGDGSLDSNSYNQDKNVTTVSSNYTVLVSDRKILVDTSLGDVTIILPDMVDLDSIGISIKKIDTSVNKIVIETPNSETIDNLPNREITTYLQSRTIITDNTNYWQI